MKTGAEILEAYNSQPNDMKGFKTLEDMIDDELRLATLKLNSIEKAMKACGSLAILQNSIADILQMQTAPKDYPVTLWHYAN